MSLKSLKESSKFRYTEFGYIDMHIISTVVVHETNWFLFQVIITIP